MTEIEKSIEPSDFSIIPKFFISDSPNQSEISKYIASCRVFWVGSYLFFSSGHVRSFPIAISAF